MSEERSLLWLYNEIKTPPTHALKTIKGGRLNGFTDISPMWRIKKLTELFGPCGTGWYPEIMKVWTDAGSDGEVVVSVLISLYIKYGDGWGKPIPGIGSNKLVAKETAGLRTNDEAFKSAYTDAMSVACKFIGMGADVYWDRDSKYQGAETAQPKAAKEAQKPATEPKTGKAGKPHTEPQKSASKPQEPQDELTAAMMTKVTIRGTQYTLGRLPQAALEWLAEKAKTDDLREAAQLILRTKFYTNLREAEEAPPLDDEE